MKAISLWQPWASLWCSSRKIHETRHWPTAHRGWMAVHAAKRFDQNFERDDPLYRILLEEFGPAWRDLPRGCIIGAVKIIACRRTEDVVEEYQAQPEPDDFHCGDFYPGRFAWQRGEFILLPQAIFYRGMQGLFDIPDDLVPIHV